MGPPPGGGAPSLGRVQRVAAGWQASFGEALVVGVYASEELAQRSLDLLQLKAAMDSPGEPLHAAKLLLPLQDYLDERTLSELRAFDLAAVLGAVRSYAVGGRRAPRCAVVASPAAAALRAPSADEGAAYRGITRDNNGRNQWIALLYASLDKEKRPVAPSQRGKTSLYIACCRNAHEAAVAHDLAALWWHLGLTYAHLWDGLDAAPSPAPSPAPSGAPPPGAMLWQGAGASGEAGDARQRAVPLPPEPPPMQLPEELLPETVEWSHDRSVLKQLNFSPDSYLADQPLMRQLLQERTLAGMRSLLSRLRNSGDLARLADGCRAAQPPTLFAGGAPPPPPPAAPPARRPGTRLAAGRGRRDHRGSPSPPPPPRRDRHAGVELGKHGRLHDKPYMGLVRDRQITLHPWRPMICAMVEGHSKPQPRSLASCASAEEAAVARDLGWIWLWRRSLTLRQHASLNFPLASYEQHGGALLDEVAAQQSLEALRGYLRGLRDTGRLLSLAQTLESELGAPGGIDARRGRPVPRSLVGVAGLGGAAGPPGSEAAGADADVAGDGGDGADADADLELAAAEMLALHGGGARSGSEGTAARSQGSGAGRSRSCTPPPSSPGASSGLEAGAVEASDDEEWASGRRRAKRARATPPAHVWPSGVAPPSQQQQPPAPAGQGGGDAAAPRFIGVQRSTGTQLTTQRNWIPRPTVRVPARGGTVSKQLTLCYCATAEEAAVARDIATLWSWGQQEQLGGQEAFAAHRLNFAPERYHAVPWMMERLRAVPNTEAMQGLAKHLRDSGTLRLLADALCGPPAAGDGDGGDAPQQAEGAPPALQTQATPPAQL